MANCAEPDSVPSLSVSPGESANQPLPGAVEALSEMVAEGLDVVIWLGTDVMRFAERLAWVSPSLLVVAEPSPH